MKTKWILVAAVTAAALTNGCMAFKEISGNSRESSSSDWSGSEDGTLAETDRTGIDEAVSRSADATSRAAAAADRAAAVAARASTTAERTETGFQKGLRK